MACESRWSIARRSGTSALPPITHALVLDATPSGGFNGTAPLEIEGNLLPAGPTPAVVADTPGLSLGDKSTGQWVSSNRWEWASSYKAGSGSQIQPSQVLR